MRDTVARNVRKVANRCVFPIISGLGGSKSRLPKAAGAFRGETKNSTPLWHEAHFQVNMYKTHRVRTTSGSLDVEKLNPTVARSTFVIQNVQDTPFSDHFSKFRESASELVS